MKFAGFRHLQRVLLILGVLATVILCEETSTSVSTTAARGSAFVAREKKHPRLDHVNGLKKPPPKSEIIQEQQNSPDDSTSTTPRSFRTDYLAKNTVPVAVAPTEATRKFSRSRLAPGPSPALLAFKATSGSTTERGFETSITPTGWALASLGPSPASSKPTGFAGKRLSSPSTMVKPISTFWSTRLFKMTTQSSFSETPEEQGLLNHTAVRTLPTSEDSLIETSFPPTSTAASSSPAITTSVSATSTTSTASSETEKTMPSVTTSTETVKMFPPTESTTRLTISTPSSTSTIRNAIIPSNGNNSSKFQTTLEENFIKTIPFSKNELNQTTTKSSGNKPEENTIATPVLKTKQDLESSKIEEPQVLATKFKIQDSKDESIEHRTATEEPVITTSMESVLGVSETEIPTTVETNVTTTEQTLTTIAKTNSTSKTITLVNEPTQSLDLSTTTIAPSSTLSNDIPDFSKVAQIPPMINTTTAKVGITDNYIPISTTDSNSQTIVQPRTTSNTVDDSNVIKVMTTPSVPSTKSINHSTNEIKPSNVNENRSTSTTTTTAEPSSSTPIHTTTEIIHTNLSNFHYDLDNKTETPSVVLTEGGGGSEEDDDSLKYNVTHHEDHDEYDDLDQSVTSIPAGPVPNVTSTAHTPINGSAEPTSTTSTSTPQATSGPVITTVSIVISETTTFIFDHTIPGEDEDDGESVIVPMNVRVHVQASFPQMCLVKEQFRNAIVSALSEETNKPVEPDQVEILNLGPNECESLMSTDGDDIPVTLLLMTPQGKYDKSLTEILFNLIKHGRLNFKYPITQVDKLVSQMLEPPVHKMGGTVIAAIVISSIAGVCLLFLTILLVIMRKRQKGFNYGQRCTPVSLDDYSLDNISVYNSVRRKAMRASKRSYGNPAFDDPVALTNPLNFAGLTNALSDKSKIEEEFERVPTVSVKPDELPVGVESKNRYANVIPLPETRVPLKEPSSSATGNDVADHFINANYVKGAKGADKFYIACQAPLQDTVPDFWQMIWEQQSRVIIMLTDLHENGADKSADYLPPSEVLDCHRIFGNLQVTLKKREVRDKYVISSLQLKNLVSNLWREVTHLWYSGWPTRGVPQDCSSMIAFLIEARSYSKAGPPVVVHCSPGTGRTGTVIAIDTAIRDFETDRSVDIPKTVYSIRRDRAGAVQTSQQYLFIYQVLHLYATKLAGGGLDSI